MKLSNFKNKGIAKKIQYNNGEPRVIEYDKLDGDITFYSLDEDVLNKINNEIVSKISPDDKEASFMYRLIPYITDVEVDVTLAEFEEMLKSTNKNFIKFIEVLMVIINDTLEMADSVGNIQSTANTIIERVGVEVETDENKLDRLYSELENAPNRNQRRRLMKEISELEMKMNIHD